LPSGASITLNGYRLCIMSSIVSIELLLDPETEELVRADWTRLAAAGFSSMAAHTSPSNRPHITLLVRPTLDAVDFTAASRLLPLPVELDEPITFRHGDRAVLARGVVPGSELLEFHRIIHEIAGVGDDVPHTKPGEWVPHVTLARRLLVDTLPDALALLGPPRSARVTGLRRWDSLAATVTPLT
jgi:2'-5' RNA ligase